MKLGALSMSVGLLGLLLMLQANSQDNFQSGTIVSVEKRVVESSSKHTDSPSHPERDTYDIGIQVNGTIYNCVYHSHPDLDPSWAVGKEVQVRMSGSRAIQVKRASGHVEKLGIATTRAAEK